jgi:hypothetical protein
LVLSLHMNERGGSAFPAVAVIAQETGYARSTVQAALAALGAAGWLKREVGKGRGHRSRYWASVPVEEKAREPGLFDEQEKARLPAVKGPATGPQLVFNEGVSEDVSTIVDSVESTIAPLSGTKALVAHFVDYSRERHGSSPPSRTIGALSKQVKALVDEGQPVEAVQQAIEAVVDKGRAPAALPDLTLHAKAVQAGRPRGRSEASRYIDEHGWPSGSRFRHGSHGGQYVQDPLGHDKPPYVVPWGRPSIDDIAKALKARREADDQPAA